MLLRRVLPDLIHILNAHIDLALRVVRQRRVCKALIQRQLASVRCDLEHIILFGFYHAAANGFGAFAQFSYHVLLIRAGLRHDGDALMLRNGQLQHFCRLDVR